MDTETLIPVDSDNHIFNLDKQGYITHAIFSTTRPPYYKNRIINEPITDYSVLPFQDYFHLLYLSKAGIYYSKFPMHKKHPLLQLRVSSKDQLSHPYLFVYHSILYACYIETDEKHSKLIMIKYQNGNWDKQVLLDDEESGGSITDVDYVLGKQGQLHVLFRCININGESILSYIQYDIKQKSKTIKQLFLEKDMGIWQIKIGINSKDCIHFAWSISHPSTTSYYYWNLSEQNQAPVLLLQNEQKGSVPYFLFQNQMVVLLFWNKEQGLICFYSTNHATTWTTYQELHLTAHASLHLIKGVNQYQHPIITPTFLLGIGFPFFRPLEFIDIVNPWVWNKAAAPSVELFQNNESSHRIQEMVDEYFQLERKEIQMNDYIDQLKLTHKKILQILQQENNRHNSPS